VCIILYGRVDAVRGNARSLVQNQPVRRRQAARLNPLYMMEWKESYPKVRKVGRRSRLTRGQADFKISDLGVPVSDLGLCASGSSKGDAWGRRLARLLSSPAFLYFMFAVFE